MPAHERAKRANDGLSRASARAGAERQRGGGNERDAFAHRNLTSAIRDAIIRGEFVPGQSLVGADLAERFGATRDTVRSALLELAHEGLVERIQNRSARVRAVTLAEAIEIYEVRMALEGMCAAKAAERVTGEQAGELRALGEAMRLAVTAGSLLEYSELNQTLHRRIVEISGHATTIDLLERLRARNVRHQFRLALLPGRPIVSLAEHATIIDRICAHLPAEAGRAAERHLSSVIVTLRAAETG